MQGIGNLGTPTPASPGQAEGTETGAPAYHGIAHDRGSRTGSTDNRTCGKSPAKGGQQGRIAAIRADKAAHDLVLVSPGHPYTVTAIDQGRQSRILGSTLPAGHPAGCVQQVHRDCCYPQPFQMATNYRKTFVGDRAARRQDSKTLARSAGSLDKGFEDFGGMVRQGAARYDQGSTTHANILIKWF
jgi:hypothetical protein